MSTFVPLISSGTAGPLGVLHLPRFWQKASLEAVGKLEAMGLHRQESLRLMTNAYVERMHSNEPVHTWDEV